MIDDLPPMDDEGHLVLQPKAIIDTREGQLRSRMLQEFLVRWKNFPDEDATWRVRKSCRVHHFSCLRTSNILPRETVIFLISHG